MFVVSEERTFIASHAIQFTDGTWEPIHSHEWLLRVFVRANQLDDFNLVVDFLDLQKYLDEVLAPFEGKELNQVPPFHEGMSPTTEYLAWYIYQQLAPKIDDHRVQLYKVELREAPTSWGIYEIPAHIHSQTN